MSSVITGLSTIGRVRCCSATLVAAEAQAWRQTEGRGWKHLFTSALQNQKIPGTLLQRYAPNPRSAQNPSNDSYRFLKSWFTDLKLAGIVRALARSSMAPQT